MTQMDRTAFFFLLNRNFVSLHLPLHHLGDREEAEELLQPDPSHLDVEDFRNPEELLEVQPRAFALGRAVELRMIDGMAFVAKCDSVAHNEPFLREVGGVVDVMGFQFPFALLAYPAMSVP